MENRDYREILEPSEGDVDWSPHYAAALAGRVGAIEEGAPQPGYYRFKSRGAWVAVGFWNTEDGLACFAQGRNVLDQTEQGSLWISCAKKAIPKAIWFEAVETGRWADGAEEVLVETERGSNLPSDPFQALKIQVDSKLEFARDWLKKHPKVATKADADYARNLQEQLAKLKGAAEPMFKTEKQPWLAGGKAVDDKFRFREDLGRLADMLQAGWQEFARAETRRLQAEAAEQHRKEQAAARAQAEAERKALEEAYPNVPLPEVMPELPLAPAPAVEKVMIGGGYGKRASVSRSYVGRITDFERTIEHFKLHPSILQAVQRLVDAAVKDTKGKAVIPGVTVTDDLGTVISGGEKLEVAA